MREVFDIVIQIMTNLILPLLKDILFEKWKEYNSRKQEKQD